MRSVLRFGFFSMVAALSCACAARAQGGGPAGPSSQPRNALAETPQATLVIAFYRAGREGDDDALRRCLTVEAARSLSLDKVRAMMKAPAAVVTKVTVTGTRSSVHASYAPPPSSSSSARPSLPPDLGVTTATGTSLGFEPGSLGSPYPRTPSQAQQEDKFDPNPYRQPLTPMPSPAASARGFVDHFQLVLVGTEWKIQKVERKTK